MHIAEGYLPPLHAVAWTVVAAPFVVHGARAVVRQVRDDPDSKLLLGVARTRRRTPTPTPTPTPPTEPGPSDQA